MVDLTDTDLADNDGKDQKKDADAGHRLGVGLADTGIKGKGKHNDDGHDGIAPVEDEDGSQSCAEADDQLGHRITIIPGITRQRVIFKGIGEFFVQSDTSL